MLIVNHHKSNEAMQFLVVLLLTIVTGGVTHNLLLTVLEIWIVVEHRRRGFAEENLEINYSAKDNVNQIFMDQNSYSINIILLILHELH